ncbi:NADP-dependent oxidoreductase [Protofrankia symbiont of Coriaria ruscifolia]|uniref:NADP-dependent oxidoreductase n=1 Tax=Protofrankia symbiont of Coriaria ruscifolia TaxID=1306542 RepID=UPI001A94E7DF|nr:NADP-dependent oxidoreductase [Protofrankia symbiont of Coriaria ruscifolia]
MKTVNRQIRLATRPVGLPRPGDWEQVEEPVPSPGEGEFLVELCYLSLDPAMRGWMNEARSYVRPVALGEVMRAFGAGRVVLSNHPGFAVGDHVTGLFGVQEYAVSDGQGVVTVDPGRAPLPTYLGALGMPGLTAYFGLLDVGRPRPGDTVVVSGAAGAVGSVAGQIAKRLECRVVGIAGGVQKCGWLVDELGFDAAVDYKSQDVQGALRKYAPDGVDVYFDNVGGDILDDVLTHLARGARVVICGAISQYNATTQVRGPRNYRSLLIQRASMTGMLVSDYADRYPAATADLAAWLADGSLRPREDVVPGGIGRFPEALLMLFAGRNTGKLVLEITGS